MNSKPSYGDSGFVSYGASVHESSHVLRSAPQDIRPDSQSLVFQFQDCLFKSLDSSPSPRESSRNSPEKTTCTIDFPGHYTQGFQDGGIEFCIPGVAQGIFTPYDDINIHFELEKEADTEQASLNCFVNAAKTLLDWRIQNQERVKGYDQTELKSETQEQRMPRIWEQQQNQHEADDIQPYDNYFCGHDPNNDGKYKPIERRNCF